MSDIRGFFGGNGSKAQKTATPSSGTTTKSSSSSSSVTKPSPLKEKNDKNDMKENNIPQAIPITSSSSSSSTTTTTTTASSSSSSKISNKDEQHNEGKKDIEPKTLPREIEEMVTWKFNENIPYNVVVDTFDAISRVNGRLDKEALFIKLFRSVILTNPNELDTVVYLCSNTLSPAYEGLELGIGDSLLVKAICEATGRKKDGVDDDYNREGDLGTVALLSRASQKTLSFAAKPKPLKCVEVLEQLRNISKTKGDKAQGRKVDIIKALMIRCQGNEAKYIVRSLQGKLRIGTAAQTVLVSLAHAANASPTDLVKQALSSIKIKDDNADEDLVSNKKDDSTVMETDSDTNLSDLILKIKEKEPREAMKLRTDKHLNNNDKKELAEIAVKRAFSECPNINILVSALISRPLHQLYKSCRLIPGVPVAPMLAKPTKAIGEVLKRLSGLAFTMEYKYDGERAQVHLLEDGSVKIFSRNSEDNTEKYPDLMDVIRRARNPNVTSCVLDAEVVAYDREKGCLLPFQILSTRKRKVEGGEEAADNQKVKVVLQAFDMLYINGKSLLTESFRTRRDLLRASFTTDEGFFYFASGADHVENGDTAPIEALMQEACTSMCEGLMVKTLDSNASYEPSKRSLNWLKLKKDYIDGMGVCDSVDLVVIGGYRGKGKRTNVYGAYLMACYDPDRDEFQSTCKVGTGFKDEELLRFTEKMKNYIIPSHRRPMNYNVGDPLEPDDWFEASVVWELQAADLSQSSVHKGAIGRIDGGRGIGLRFPRFIRERDDKKAENCTNAEQIADMYLSQDLGEGTNPNVNNDEDEDDDLI